ncbi:TonB-dependent receptor domain-containing protein [Tenacibaculum sp. IB213877]|uniref:TonB-dependent receptor n=1 Tax=Tenacibaculum sp. IB213877 TaxID=3097351 RepID=UPI002A59C667|nr:TonB-dependent receptor [Tenacibaculum sp. IB213877]MDY0781309.1 TonB-dependent receptor [Tenacibaculum sp. IB213877]
MKLTLTTLLLFIPFAIFSQQITVIDAESGKPIETVVLHNLEKTKNAVSDENGKADISIFNEKETIYFSHVSYAEFTSLKNRLEANNYKVYLSKFSEQLDEVVLSVFRTEAKTNRIAEQIEVVNTKEIQKLSPQTSADLLANIPGIKIQKSQFGGGSPVLRGMESNRVLLVVDGVRMNNAIYRKGHLQNSITVAPFLLDKTEVVFGPTSVMYGSDALGGVVHYYTKSPKLSEERKVKSSLFSRFSTVNNEITNVVSAELRFPKWASLTSVSYSDFGDLTMGENRSHGFDDWGKVFFYSENLHGNYAENPTVNSDPNIQRNTGYTQTDILQKFYVPLSKNTDLKFNIQYSTSSDIPRFDRLTETKNGSLKFAEWYYGPQERLLISPQLQINPKKNWLDSGTFTLAYQNIKESRIQRKFGSLERSYRKEQVDVFSINGDFTVATSKNRNLGYGFEVAYNDVSSNSYGKVLNVVDGEIQGFSDDFSVQSRYPDGGSSYLSSAVYVDYRQDLNTKSTLNTGVRLTNTDLDAKWIDETFITLPDNNIYANHTSLTATIGYVYKPNKNWQLNSVLSSGFRSPNLDDIGKVREKNGDVTVPNADLKPEQAYSAEIGVLKYFNNRRFKTGLTAYYTLLNNYIYREDFQLEGSSTIMYDGEEGNIVANVNKGTAYVAGLTASYHGKLSNHWTTSGSVTYTQGKTYDTNLPMSSIPPLFGNFDVNYRFSKLEAGANLRFNARKKIEDYNLEEGIDNQNQSPVVNADAEEDIDKYYGTPSWTTLGLYTKYTVNENFALQARMTNLFDEHYKEFASGVSAPGRNFSVSLTANF